MHNSTKPSSSSSSSSSFQSLEDESDHQDITRFDKSLQELRHLRAQLHYAADYSETTFLNAKDKKMWLALSLTPCTYFAICSVMENTKEYICRAVVSVVDHLGTVSTSLNFCISQTNAFSEAELRINCLKQRLLVCEQYAHKLALTQLRWSENLTRHHRRYLSKPTANVEKACEGSRDTDDKTGGGFIDQHELVREQEIPLFLYTYTQKPSLEKGNRDLAVVLPVRDGLSVLSKRSINPTFHFQVTQKIGRHRRSSVQRGDILSFIRRAKRTG
ncbi:probable protein ABIL5 isoform X1 [Corylus avellana]|uniref:probable protein ABIL5 isoform X1 n=1 Tax=Corylus avellana TaxID=13451 RepID=UPI00286D5EF6|nr:probable protein ABIL5 isoform X1 [Corylus avellana]